MEQLILSSPLTHSDWMLHENPPAWGDEGVRHMLTRCKEFGFSRIYWRAFDAGKALYASRLLEPMIAAAHEEPWHCSPGYIEYPEGTLERLEKLDYSAFDSLEAAVRIGHELGLEIYAWASINEDDHGFGYRSRFVRAHPEYLWTRRDGGKYHSQLSFAFPEVRAYKLALIKELMAYDIDGLFIDWLRTGDIRDNPQCDAAGVADYGYEAPNIAAFEKQYGVSPLSVENGDPRWVACRAAPVTEFMRGVRALTLADKKLAGEKELPIVVLTAHPWAYRGVLPEQMDENTPQWIVNMGGHRMDGALRGLLCDAKTWAREGLIDGAAAAGYYTEGATAEMAFNHLREETEGRTENHLYCWASKKPEDLARDRALARTLGARELLFWEADYIDN